jgi:hypothetical protein
LALGRYFGNRSGLAYFQAQADAAFRCLFNAGLVETTDPDQLPKRCSACWLNVVYQIAEDEDDPRLLARTRTLHLLPETREEQRTKLTFAFLESDVFAASAAAVEAIIRQSPLTPIPPRWDDDNRTLYIGDEVVKVYRRYPAGSQTELLQAFQVEGWPPIIPSPFGDDAKKLNNTITKMNRALKETPLRFHGDGTGEGVGWRLEEPEWG